jgi:ABC-type multidrug transport system ATPase subunit
MRKSSGQISGEVRLNGFLQDRVSFVRASGYVEQFDVQSPELTVRETILFSARLRLDSDQFETDEEKINFVRSLMETLELLPFADTLVGSEEEGGLSFEQKKRLSIAVELAASPSIIFLDEVRSLIVGHIGRDSQFDTCCITLPFLSFCLFRSQRAV